MRKAWHASGKMQAEKKGMSDGKSVAVADDGPKNETGASHDQEPA